ncbi:MAG: ATP phosphoribosyltransferase regulatory subunit, partial [Anaerolineae bacterium]|nr:ATP phosphoribosyltransferase regulatory subunit [Anaerolineae bacterium]
DLITRKLPGTDQLDYLENAIGSLPAARPGIDELREIARHLQAANVPSNAYEFDFTMVRGLGYYTGPIFETIITEPNLGSVTGGGRYDELVGLFRGDSLPTTGTSLGIERIIDLMDILNLYPPEIGGTVVQVMVGVFSEDTRDQATALAAELRAEGICTDLYLQDRAISKQMGYADKKRIPIVALLGSEEIAQGIVKLKRLHDGFEMNAPRTEVASAVHTLLSR